MKRYRVNRKLIGIADALSSAVETPLNGAAVPLTARALRTLGHKLMRIGNGENACDVLAQTKHGAEPKTREHLDIAYQVAFTMPNKFFVTASSNADDAALITNADRKWAIAEIKGAALTAGKWSGYLDFLAPRPTRSTLRQWCPKGAQLRLR